MALDRGRDHDDFRRAEMFRAMADMDERASAAKQLHLGALGRVRKTR